MRVVARRRKGKVVAAGPETLVLAKGFFSLAAGKDATVTLHLTAAGRRRLAHAKRHALAAQLVLSLAGGKTDTTSVRVS